MFNAIINHLERSARHKTREQLIRFSDTQLIEMGFSPELLYRGTEYWPWREQKVSEPAICQPESVVEKEFHNTIAELPGGSDIDSRNASESTGTISLAVVDGKAA